MVDTDLIKKLRLKSGSGILDCKKALIDADGNFNNAIILLKKRGYIKAEKKIKNSAIRGIISTHVQDKYSYIIELNCETDFVENNVEFIKFAKHILNIAYDKKISNIQTLNTMFHEQRLSLISKFGENIIIRRFSILYDKVLFSYIHRNRIGVLIQADYNNKKILKKIAMHIAANNPDYLDYNHVPESVIEKEKEIHLDIAIKSGKPKFIADKIIHGKIEKFIQCICLLEQPYIFNTDILVKDVLFKHNINILKFIRFELGEEI